MTTTTMFIAPARHRHRHLYFCLYLYFTSTSVATLAQASESEYVALGASWGGYAWASWGGYVPRMSGPYHEAFVPCHEAWAELGIRAWIDGRDLAAEIEGKGTGTGKGKGKVEKGTGKGKGKYTWEQFLEDEGVLFGQLSRHIQSGDQAGAIARVIARVLFVYKGKGKGIRQFQGQREIEGADDNDEGGTSNVEG